jgi:hypothetical protein
MQFGTAKAVLGFLAFIGWVLSALGSIAFFYLFTQVGLLSALPAVAMVAMGLLIVAASQMGLAQIATAENTGALLELFRNGKVDLGVKSTSQNALSTPATLAPKKDGSRIKVFKGHEILRTETGVSVDGKRFGNVLDAEKWINELPR